MEAEREFLDAFSVVISSGYHLEEADFFSLIKLIRVPSQSEHPVERAKLLEFFTTAAEMLSFDAEKVKNQIEKPWEDEANNITIPQSQH